MKKDRTRQTLISRLADQNDEEAWKEFVFYYEDYIKIIFKKFRLSEEQINDSLQNTLLKIWKELPNFNYNPERGRFRSWIYTVALNDMRTMVRKEVKRQSVEKESFLPDLNSNKFETELEDEWKVYISKKAWENIRVELNDVMREAFELYLQGLNSREISEKLGISEAVARVYKQRISHRLKYEIKRLDRELC